MSRRTPPVRLGVVGCGTIAYWTHLRIARALDHATLVAAADPDPQARARAERLTRRPVHEQAQELLSRTDIDAVIIAAPSHLHAELAIAAAEAGKHFYLEKPMATSIVDARRIGAAATRAGVVATIGFNRRHHPVVERVRELIASGVLGRVHAMQTAFCEPSPGQGSPAWKQQRATGGGVLLDLASHHVDLVRWLLNQEIDAVSARVDSVDTEGDAAWIELALRGGIRVQSTFTSRAGLADTVTVFGDRGVLTIDRHRATPSLRVARRWGYGTRRAWVRSSAAMRAAWLRRLARPSDDPSYRRALAAFVDAVRGQARDLPTLDDGVRSLEVVLAAEESARRGESIRLPGA